MDMRTSTSSVSFPRRNLLIGLASAALLPATSWGHEAPLIEVWKSPSCGCCNDWITHLRTSGFRVKSYDTGNAPKRAELGMPAKLASCHTAKIDDYVIEGHVPAREIQRLLKESPKALGLSVPGMPLGSPGMDGEAFDHKTEPYNVLLVLHNGTTSVFQAY
jgi:hypothetical protein